MRLSPFESLQGVILKEVRTVPKVENPLVSNNTWQISQTRFAMQVPGVGDFYVSDGNRVEYVPADGADEEWIRIYLNGQILAALMHQRKIINFHASSFIYNGIGVLLLGETCAGKSSLTAAFVLDGSGFLSDDFTPVIFKGTNPLIWPVYKKIKLREDSLRQLNIEDDLISERENVTGKYFLKVNKKEAVHFPLDIIMKLETGEVDAPRFESPDPAGSFALLRSEVCSWEILAGMPETEQAYLQQLLDIVHQVPVVRIIRPGEFPITELYRVVKLYLDGK